MVKAPELFQMPGVIQKSFWKLPLTNNQVLSEKLTKYFTISF